MMGSKLNKEFIRRHKQPSGDEQERRKFRSQTIERMRAAAQSLDRH